MLKLYDTLTRQLEVVENNNQTIKLYSCGPTVYDFAHIGNLRSFLFPDIIKRTLEYNGQKVDWVMNITDVDDKTIKKTIEKYGATATPKELSEYTKQFTELFKQNLTDLNINIDEIRFINVSDTIPEIQKFIIGLLDKGYAYKADDGSTYFSIEKYQTDFGDYGQLVGQDFLEGKKVGARVAVDEYEKDNLSDFALWKAKHDDDGQIFWDHEILGQGRPGWHIECSVINNIAFNGEATDIHTGGVDLIFPHHTNEIAQSQPYYKPFVKHWAHSEHTLVDNKKMAKRDNNYFTLEDLKQKSSFAGPALRYLFLQSGFGTQQNFTMQSFEAAQNGLQRIFAKINSKQSKSLDEKSKTAFAQALNENINTSQSLAILHETFEQDQNIETFLNALGLSAPQKLELIIPEEVKELLEKRQTARDNKDFASSDELRKEIENLGYEIKDTDQGQELIKK